MFSYLSLYGAPIWADEYLAVKERQRSLKRLQRMVASRVVASFRTVSFDAVTLLAGTMPINLAVEVRKNTYLRTRQLKAEDALTVALGKRIKKLL